MEKGSLEREREKSCHMGIIVRGEQMGLLLSLELQMWVCLYHLMKVSKMTSSIPFLPPNCHSLILELSPQVSSGLFTHCSQSDTAH